MIQTLSCFRHHVQLWGLAHEAPSEVIECFLLSDGQVTCYAESEQYPRIRENANCLGFDQLMMLYNLN